MNNTKLTLYLGFASVMALLLTLMGISLYQINQAEKRIERVVLENNIKISHITELRTLARERTVSLEKMLIIEDPIEISDEWEKFYALGARFIVIREAYLSMQLSDDEQAILTQQADLVRDNSRLQVTVTDMIMEGKVEQARDLLLNTVMPIQDKVFEFNTRMIELQKNAAAQSLQQARTDYDVTVIAVLVLSILTLAVSFLIVRKIISGISESERQLFKEKERAQITLQSIGDAVVITDAHGKIEQVNLMTESLLCQSADKLIGNMLEDVIKLCKEENVKAEIRPVSRVMERQEIFVSSGDTILRRLDGTICPVEYSVAPINGPNRDLIGVVLTMRNVSALRALTNELAFHARYDSLTGLLNRREFERYLHDTAAEVARYPGRTAWLGVIDLDKFKNINDTYGHLAGDAVLKKVAESLLKHTRKTDYVARLGGDEFCLILRFCDEAEAMVIVERIHTSLSSMEFSWEGQLLTIGASIGITAITDTDETLASLFNKADSACYDAKREGRNIVKLYQAK